jgi:hypothetical protein
MSRRTTAPPQVSPVRPATDECVPAMTTAPIEPCDVVLDEASISALVAFFKLLDEWDTEVEPQ